MKERIYLVADAELKEALTEAAWRSRVSAAEFVRIAVNEKIATLKAEERAAS